MTKAGLKLPQAKLVVPAHLGQRHTLKKYYRVGTKSKNNSCLRYQIYIKLTRSNDDDS